MAESQRQEEVDGRERAASASRAKAAKARARQPRVVLLVGTRKGAFILHGNASRTRWRSEGPHRFGEIVNHVVLDPRDGQTLLCAARAGHLGPSIFRSTDMGKTWKEASAPPAFKPAPPGVVGDAVQHTFYLVAEQRERAERLVRGHVAAGAVPQRGRRA